MKSDAVHACSIGAASQRRRPMRPWHRVAVVCAFIAIATGPRPGGFLGIADAEQVPAPSKPGELVPAPSKPGNEATERLGPGDLVPEWLKRQAEVLRTALGTVMPVGDLLCLQRIEPGADCSFEAGDLYSTDAKIKMYQGEVVAGVTVYLWARKDELRNAGVMPAEDEIRRTFDWREYQYRTPPERFDAGVRAYVLNWIPVLHRYSIVKPGMFRAQGGARAEFLCGNALTRVKLFKQSSTEYPREGRASFPTAAVQAQLDADTVRLGEEVRPEAKKLAQKLAKAYLEAFAREKLDVRCGAPAPVDDAPDVPPLPLLIPAAPLEGTLTPWLQKTKADIERQLGVAKTLQQQVTPVEPPAVADTFDIIEFLEQWYKPQEPILEAERLARQGAEKFFKGLALGYKEMTEAERAKVEQGLETRAFALRRFRTVQRGIMRELSGKLEPATFERYFTAVARATWAAQELEALVRMWGPVNAARVAFHGRYDVYEIGDPARDPQLAADAEAAQKRHFDAMVDMGIAALLASETQFEAVTEARKSRFYGLRQGWKETAEAAYDDPKILRAGAHVVIQLLADGFNLFDIVVGITVDNLFKPTLAKVFGQLPDDSTIKWLVSGGLRTRAQKLEDQAMKNWDDTQRKLLVLRLLKKRPLTEVRAVAKQVLQEGADLTKLKGVAPGKLDDKELAKQTLPPGPGPTKLKVAPGVADDTDLALLVKDRTFYDATQGGLLRLLAATLTDFTDRCTMELRIAQEETRLVRRDMAAAFRLEQGLDPETGDLNPGLLLSPMAWADLVTKSIFDSDNYAARMAEMRRKDKQVATMEGLLGPLKAVEFHPSGRRLEVQAPQAAKDHVGLLVRSAPYIKFDGRIEDERTHRGAHEFARRVRRRTKEPDEATKAHIRYREELPREHRQLAHLHEPPLVADLQYQDLIYAWDFGSALALAETLGSAAAAKRRVAENAKARSKDPAKDERVRQLVRQAERAELYAGRVQRLREAVGAQHLKDHGVEVFRNVGDLGVMMAAFTVVRPFIARPASAALWPAAVAEEASFARFLLGSFQPLAHGPTAVISGAISEVLVDMGVPHTGQKYEALLNQLIGILVDMPIDALAAKLAKARAGVRTAIEAEGERIEYAQLDKRRYLADVMNRALMRLSETLLKWSERAKAARDPATRAAIERLAAADDLRARWWLMLEKLDAELRRLRDSLTEDVDAVTVKQFLEMRRRIDMMVSPPSIELYERILRDFKEHLFRLDHGLDIARLRLDLLTLRLLATPDEMPRLAALEEAIDRERHRRFDEALGEVLRTGPGQIRNVIVNGAARPGGPEYRGLFDHLDFIVLVPPGTDHAAVRQAVEAAFGKKELLLNAKGRPTSVDVEATILDIHPGGPLDAESTFKQWLTTLYENPDRFLSPGGAEWLALRNYLIGRTVHLEGEKATVDATADPTLVPKPEIHPILAHGVVLDAARLDTLRDPGSIGDTAVLAEMTTARAQHVLRAVDALVWAVYPDLLRARTPEAAGKEGYHKLLLDDARALVERGLLSPDEFETLQYLIDIQAGKSAVKTLGLDPNHLEGGRARLEEHWRGMNDLMRRCYRDTRRVYLGFLGHFAKTPGGLEPDHLFALTARNWNTAGKIPPDSLALLAERPEGGLVEQQKGEEREIIAPGLDHDPSPPQVILTKAGTNPEVLPSRLRRADPDPGPDPHARPTAVQSARAPPKTPDPPFRPEEITEPLDLAALEFRGNGEVYLNGRRVGSETAPVDPSDPQGLSNDVAAYLLGRRLGVLVPWATRHTIASGPRAGQQVVVVRLVRSLVPETAPGTDLLRIILDLPGRRIPGGFDAEVLNRFKTDESKTRLRAYFVQDVLLSAILGDPDPKSVVTLGGELASVEHMDAQATDPANLARKEIAGRMRDRLQNPLALEVARALEVKTQDLLDAWREMAAKLVRPDGTFDPDALRAIARETHGLDGDPVLLAWNGRTGVMVEALAQIFQAQQRAGALDLGLASFRADTAAQLQLYEAAQWMRAAQEELARQVLADLGAQTAILKGFDFEVKLKRDRFEEFRDGILEKVERKKYKTVSEMDDIARGRINVATRTDVEGIASALMAQGRFDVVNAQPPKPAAGVENGYPRYHVILKDKVTGLTYEWQVGTQRTTDFFEREGIELHGLTLKKGMKRNIHDIEYDIFKYLQEDKDHGDPQLAAELGIPEFRKRVAEVSARTLEGTRMPEAELEAKLTEMHRDASLILKKLIDMRGIPYVQSFFH